MALYLIVGVSVYRSGSYKVTVSDGDSGNPLIETSPDGTPTKSPLNKDNTEELKENYRLD